MKRLLRLLTYYNVRNIFTFTHFTDAINMPLSAAEKQRYDHTCRDADPERRAND